MYFSIFIVISVRTAMFSFRKSNFRLVGLFDWVYARTKFILSVSRNRYGFTLAGYRNEKYATDPALIVLQIANFSQITHSPTFGRAFTHENEKL